jgi:hypothetical protein
MELRCSTGTILQQFDMDTTPATTRSRDRIMGIDGKPAPLSAGIATIRNAYDARNNMIEESYFGVDGKPSPLALGEAKVVYLYDNSGRETEAHYFDPANRRISVDLVVEYVFRDTTSEKIGLRAGDRILSYGGHRPTSARQFTEAESDNLGREPRILVIGRGADVLQFAVAPGWLGVSVEMAVADPPAKANSTPSPAQPLAESR